MTPARRLFVPALHVVALLVLAAAVYAQIDRPLAPALGPAPPPEALFGADFIERARAYRDPRHWLRLLALVLTVAVPVWWALAARGQRLTGRIAARWGAHRPLRAAAVVTLALVVAVDLVVLPVVFWTGFVQEGQYGFRTQGLAGWARDWVVAHAPVWLGATLLVPLGVAVVRRLPRAWPPLLGLATGLLSAGLTIAAPVILEPLWLQTTPLPPGGTRDAIEAVVARADVPVDRILVADASRRSTKANAYVSGLGGTRRVVLFDTLLAQAEAEEVALVVAHELAHDAHRDIARGVLLGTAGGIVAAYALALALRTATAQGVVTGPADPRAVPLALAILVVLTVVSLPLQSAISRRGEAAADWAALELTREPAAFAGMQRTLAASHLADPSPPGWVHWLWYTHPSARDRIGMAQAWAERRGHSFRLPPPVSP